MAAGHASAPGKAPLAAITLAAVALTGVLLATQHLGTRTTVIYVGLISLARVKVP